MRELRKGKDLMLNLLEDHYSILPFRRSFPSFGPLTFSS